MISCFYAHFLCNLASCRASNHFLDDVCMYVHKKPAKLASLRFLQKIDFPMSGVLILYYKSFFVCHFSPTFLGSSAFRFFQTHYLLPRFFILLCFVLAHLSILRLFAAQQLRCEQRRKSKSKAIDAIYSGHEKYGIFMLFWV